MNRLNRILALTAALLCGVSSAKADFAFTVGSGQTGFSFTASTGGTSLCAASVTHCFASVPINTAGAAIFTAAAPGAVNTTNWGGTLLGAASAYGTSPGAVNVPGVNAFITGSGLGYIAPTTTSGASGTVAMCGSTTAVSGQSNGNLAFLNCSVAGALRTDLYSISGTAASVNNGTVDAGTLRVTLASNGTGTVAVTNTGTFAVQSAATLTAETTKVIGTVRNVGNVGGVFDAVSGAAVPANLLYYGVNVGGNITPVVGDPCQTNAHSYQPISQTTSTQLFAGTSAKKTYVCHVFVLANAAETVTLVSGTGTVCATSPHAMIGPSSVTALSAVSANGGFSLGSGGYAIAASTTNADNVCLVQLGAVQLTGVISYVAQ